MDDDAVMSDDGGDSSDDEAQALAEERMNYGAKYTKTTKDKTQPAPSATWTLVDPAKMPKQCRREEVAGHLGTKYGAELINIPPNTSIDSLRKLANHLRPPEWLPKLVSTANNTLYDNPQDPNYRKTTECEMEVILGMMLSAAVMGVGSLEECFAINTSNESICPPPGFGQYGVCKNRALIVYRKSHLSDGPQQPAGKDPNWLLDGPLSEFNNHLANSYRSSWLSTMDESGPPWHGAEGEGDYNICPHITVCHRKPEPICAQFNDTCDAITRVVTMVEFEKAKKYHADSKYMDEVGTYNAAMTTRLVEPVKDRNALTYADSRFGSVKAAHSCKKRKRVDTAFDVKTGTSLFPRPELVRLCPKEHGAIVIMTAVVDGVDMIAIGQRRGPSVHTFLSTCGTFELEIPARYPSIKDIRDAPYTTPALLNIITKAQPGIDCINRQLFDLLGMHDTFTTRCFETRFSHHFMLPLSYINAINAGKYFLPELYRDMATKPMLMKLAYEMVHNPEWQLMRGPMRGPSAGPRHNAPPPVGPTRSGSRYQPAAPNWQQVRIDGGPPSRESPAKHVLILLSQVPGYKGAKQQRCWECNELCSWCCARCSTATSWVPLHPVVAQGSRKEFACLAHHRTNPAGGYKVSHQIHTGTSTTAKRRRRIPFVTL